MSTWATPEDAADLWPDSTDLSPAGLEKMLGAAQEACAAYAPALAADDAVPYRYTLAVVMHARDLWNAVRRGPDGALGPEDFPLQVRPLSLDVRQLLRPMSPVPTFGGGA